ncbi:MAG: RdgB/HAM1 family non-canonical purine NTP pyrophosphatase [Frankiales bacterium]|nr:RdgB/HAM1 family non-canonical purine NTP pyrophosphatase [Frankiales bacterium]
MTSPPLRIVLATRNPHKLEELRRILAVQWPPKSAGNATGAFDIVGLDDVPGVPEVVEDGETFADNAVKKAVTVAKHTGLVAIADDSGLEVDALNGMPGVLSARWSGRHGADEANLRLVLDQVADVPDERRGAAFVCAAVAARPDGAVLVREGRVDGCLLRAARGSGGFGYDPIFLPDGSELTTAEMAPEAKDAISHRGRALRALAADLPAFLAELPA